MGAFSSPRRRRGFTLVELMVVVALIGILSAIAVGVFRKYFGNARSGEAISVMQGIRAAEESFRAHTGNAYLNVSVSASYYPRDSGFDGKALAWDYPHADHDLWELLAPTVTAPVKFGYKVNAGPAGQAPAMVTQTVAAFAWPASPAEPWYVIQARGDPDMDGVMTFFVGSSFTGEIVKEGN